ncbi:3-oxoacyl-ACP reductase FabG [Roseicella sp. DB1501]|uniref:3-oxoacyl-ACP reductase FabG n=1 Tax=Roseicella sp. DB1501 TaxID=2730925 RepID=UPI0014910D7B|nr:3-oxoacyl-ACP reductase FabG [Roseicella sp. DB1501]NOG69905.1 3-oxoacyl-ACP reductase FabG [Roseicella sp. DB1501]
MGEARGRLALVTGGASPIGAAICRRLAADGHAMLVHAHAGLERAEALAAALRAGGAQAAAFACDLTDAAATAAALEARPAGGDRLRGPVQILVHNAGTHADAPLAGMSESQWRGVIDVSLNGFYAVLQPLLLPMIGTRWGRIIAISSVSGLIGNRGQANYAAAKAGLIGAVKSLSLEYAARGVTANAVAPGIIESPAVAAVLTPERIAQLVPARRAGRPEEVADLVGFLASERAGYITGQAIGITGGLG